MNWHGIMAISAHFYYLILLDVIVATFFTVYGIIKLKKLGNLKVLLVYSTLSILQILFAYYVSLKDYSATLDALLNNSVNIFVVVEFTVFFTLIYKALIFRLLKILFIFFAIAFAYSIFYYWTFTDEFYKNPSRLTSIESVIFIISSLLYFYQSFKDTSSKIKWIEPHFWIVSGILFLFCSILPLFLLLDYFSSYFSDIYFNIYSLNYVGYLILFCFFFWGMRSQVKLYTINYLRSNS